MKKSGVTLVEMLVVIAVIMVLVSISIGIAGQVNNWGKQRLTVNTLAILDAALRQFCDYQYQYNYRDYKVFRFPLDCNDGLPPNDTLINIFQNEFQQPISIMPASANPIQHRPEWSGCEGMYFFLSRIPECRKTLARLDNAAIIGSDENANLMQLVIGQSIYPLLRIVDAWGTTLHYDYYDEMIASWETRRTFPVIASAGPDRIFGTTDDISNRSH